MTAHAHVPVDWPDRIDPQRRTVTFVQTTASRLRAAAFLDGRVPLGEGPSRSVAIGELPRDAAAPAPMLLHVSFCGLTLLSRLLDVPGRTLSLREPRVQVDLADWRAAFGLEPPPDVLVAAIRGTTALLSRPVANERVVMKPSNWANVLLPDWARGPAAIDPVFLTMAPRAFVTAVFRGGRERLGFTMRGASHFARLRPDGEEIVGAAIGQSTDPLDRAARLAVAALAFQHALFADACALGGWDEDRVIDFATLRADPVATALRVARLLDLPFDADDIIARAMASADRNAKAPDQPFTATDEVARDAVVRLHHGDRIDAALRWGERVGLV